MKHHQHTCILYTVPSIKLGAVYTLALMTYVRMSIDTFTALLDGVIIRLVKCLCYHFNDGIGKVIPSTMPDSIVICVQ